MICIIFFLCFNLSTWVLPINGQTADKLEYAQVLFRHGNRTIRQTYPNDPYNKNLKINFPEGLGQLTKLGEQYEYKLGQFLKRRYGNFLGTYGPNKLSTFSSYLNRTIYSGKLVLSALFPQTTVSSIPIQSIAYYNDTWLLAEAACKRYWQIYQYLASPEITAMYEKHIALFQYLEKNSGKPIRYFQQLADLYDILFVENSLNKTLPVWAQGIIKPGGEFQSLTVYWYTLLTYTTLMKRLKSGFLLKYILDQFKNKTTSIESGQLMRLFSAHETTIASMLNTLGLFQPHIPPYASSLHFELYKSGTNTFYVQVFYRNTTVEKPEPMYIPNCGTKCSLSQLYQLYNDVLPLSTSECQLKN